MSSKPEKILGTFPSKKNVTFFQVPDHHLIFPQKRRPPEDRTGSRRNPTHVYLKKNTYYFRYAFPLVHKQRLGYSKIRFGLRTGYKKKAQEYARILYGNLRELLMSEQELDYPSIKIRLNKLLLKLMHQVDHKNAFKISFPMALPGLKPVLEYPDLSQAEERLKEVANGLLVKFEKNHALAQLSKDEAFSEQETLENRATILRSYPSFYTALRSYAYAHGKSDLQQKGRPQRQGGIEYRSL